MNLPKNEKEKRWQQHLSDSRSGVVTQKSVVRKEIKAATGKSARVNPYLHALLDPEDAGKGVGVPDEFAAPTFKCQQIINVPVSVDADNNFAIQVRPTPRYTVGMTGADTTEVYTLANYTIANITNSLTSVIPDHQRDFETEYTQSFLTNSVIGGTDVVTVIDCKPVGREGPNVWPYKHKDPSQGYFYRYDPNALININVLSNHDVNAGDIMFNFNLYDRDFNLLSQEHIGNNGSGVAWTVPFSLENYELGSMEHTADTYYFLLQDMSVGAFGDTARVLNFQMYLSLSASVYTAADTPIISSWLHCPDIETMTEQFDYVRPVSMSVWCNYRGSVLANDSIASRLCFTGDDALDLESPVLDYNFLSKCSDSYNGPLNAGTYVLWRPTQLIQASSWSRVLSADWNFLPYVVVSGHMPNEGVVNLRVVINFEVQTTSTLYQLTPTLYSPDELAHAMLALAHFKPAMENANHRERILSLLKSGGKLLYNNRSPLAAAALTATGNIGMVPAVTGFLNALPNWK